MDRIKKLIQDGLHQLGYNVVKVVPESGVSFPYVRRYWIDPYRFDFWIGNSTGKLWYDNGQYQNREDGGIQINHEGEAGALLDLTEKGDRILEIGSHHGFYTMLLSCAAGEEGYVLGVEADAQNAMIAQSQAALNGFGDYCRVLYAAGSDRTGRISLSTTDGSNAHVCQAKEQAVMTAEAVRGDDLAKTYGPFTLLKVDVEGFEEMVLRGCGEILRERPKLALELHLGMLANYGSKPQTILDLIGAEGYEGVYSIWPDPNRFYPFDAGRIPEGRLINLFLRPR